MLYGGDSVGWRRRRCAYGGGDDAWRQECCLVGMAAVMVYDGDWRQW